jgi:hypothetical protein
MKYYLLNEQDIYELSCDLEHCLYSFLDSKEYGDDEDTDDQECVGPDVPIKNTDDTDF